VLGIVEGKDAAGIVAEMKALDARFILTHPRSTMKASGLAGLTQACQAAGLRFEVIERLDGPAQLPASDNLLFTGSFYTALIGEALFNP